MNKGNRYVFVCQGDKGPLCWVVLCQLDTYKLESFRKRELNGENALTRLASGQTCSVLTGDWCRRVQLPLWVVPSLSSVLGYIRKPGRSQ